MWDSHTGRLLRCLFVAASQLPVAWYVFHSYDGWGHLVAIVPLFTFTVAVDAMRDELRS